MASASTAGSSSMELSDKGGGVKGNRAKRGKKQGIDPDEEDAMLPDAVSSLEGATDDGTFGE